MTLIDFPKDSEESFQKQVENTIKDANIFCQPQNNSICGGKNINTGLLSYSFFDIFM